MILSGLASRHLSVSMDPKIKRSQRIKRNYYAKKLSERNKKYPHERDYTYNKKEILKHGYVEDREESSSEED